MAEPTTDAENLQQAVEFVKGVLWITGTDQDTLLWVYINSAVAKIEELTWIDLLALWVQTKKFDGAGQNILFLNKYVEPSKVQYNENKREQPNFVDFGAYDYVFNKNNWQLVFKNTLQRGYQNILVEFSYDFTDFNSIPRSLADLKLALALLVWNIQASQKSTWISSESVSGTTLTFDKSTMTENVKTLLNKFLIVVL